MNPLSTVEKYLIGIAVILILMLVSGFYGWYKEHEVLVAYKATVAELGKAQQEQVAQLKKSQEEYANEADVKIQNATSAIADYYTNHPVIRVQYSNTSCVPGAPDITKGVGQTSESAVPTASEFISDYNPEEVELMADQLDQLLQLLNKDGIKFK